MSETILTNGFKLQPNTPSKAAMVAMLAASNPALGITESNTVFRDYFPSPTMAEPTRTYVAADQYDSEETYLIQLLRLDLSTHLTPRLTLELPLATLTTKVIVDKINEIGQLALGIIDVDFDETLIVTDGPYYMRLTAKADSPVWCGSMLIKVVAPDPA
jgi:hypothetical protein